MARIRGVGRLIRIGFRFGEKTLARIPSRRIIARMARLGRVVCEIGLWELRRGGDGGCMAGWVVVKSRIDNLTDDGENVIERGCLKHLN